MNKMNKDRFDKPYRVLSTYDEKKAMELFSLVEKLDTHELLKFSLSNQIPWDIQNTVGNSLIHELLLFNAEKISGLAKLPICKFLVQNGCNPDSPNKQNQTPLHIACMYQLEPIIKYLLEIGVDPNYQDNLGNTPIYYLLNGLIKSVEQDNTLGNIYQSKEKKVIDKFNIIVQIKQKISQLGQNITQSENLPLISTITKTIENLIDIDSDIKNNFIKLQEIIMAQSIKTSQDPFENINIKNSIELIRNKIKDKIESKFGKFKTIDNFKIHETTPTSWAQRSNKSSQSLIQNGNIKKVINDDIKTNISNIKSSISNFVPKDISNLMINFNNLLNQYVESISKFTTINGELMNYSNVAPVQPPAPAPISNLEDYKKWLNNLLDLNNTMKHPNCPDSWSHNICWEESRLMANNINVLIIDPPSFHNDFDELLYIRNTTNSQEAVVVGALGDILQIPNIITITMADYTHWYNFEFIVLLEPPVIAGGLYRINQASQLFNDINGLHIDYRTDYYWYIILAWTAILNPEKFDNLKNFNFEDENGNLVDRTFADKWLGKFKNYPLKTWLFNLYCDFHRHRSFSNLDVYMPFKFLMLCTGLDTSNIIRSVYRAYKPHIITEIVKRKENQLTPEGMEIMFMMLLQEFIIANHINNSVRDPVTGEYVYNPAIVGQDILNIGRLIKDFCQNKNIVIQNVTNNLDHILTIITNKYDNMTIKPLKQNWNDACFILCNYHNLPKHVNLSFDYINRVLDVENDSNNMDKIIKLLNSNQHVPSSLSILNYWLDYCNEYVGSNNILVRNYNALKLAHVMGLKYEGTCNIHAFLNLSAITANNPQNAKNKTPSIIKLSSINEHIINQHQFRKNDGTTVAIVSLENGCTPLPFGNLFYTNILLDKDIKAHFNNLDNREDLFPNTIISPIDGTNLQFNNITNVQNPLIAITEDTYKAKIENNNEKYEVILKIILNRVNSIINDLSNGKTTRLGEIFITHIHSIIKIATLSNSKFNLKDLVKNINRINSNYYLYYYLYTPSQLIKLSRFNYWQIPESTIPEKYQYWDDQATELTFNLVAEIGNNESNISKVDKGLLNFYPATTNKYTLVNLTPEDFKRLKSSSLPPSLYVRLDDFYKYVVIELSKYIIQQIDTNKLVGGLEKEIYDLTFNLLNQSNITPDVGTRDLLVYNIVCKILEELVKNVIDSNITKYISEFYFKTLSTISPDNIRGIAGAQMDLEFSTTIINANPLTIHLGKTNINFDKITKTRDVKNIFNVISQQNTDMFILYPNDFTITNKYLNKSRIVINPNIINLLIKYHSTPDIKNFDGMSPFTSIIKTYNYSVIKEFKKYGIDFRFSGRDLVEILINEVNDNVSKVLGSNNTLNKLANSSMKSILNNIYNHQSSEITNLINSNLEIKNNIPLNLDTSFAICSHITLQSMSELLLRINPDFAFENLAYIFDLIDNRLNTKMLSINVLDIISGILNVPNDVNVLFLLNIKNNKSKEYRILYDKEEKLRETIKNLEPALKLKIETTDLNELQQKILLLYNEITHIHSLLIGSTSVRSIIHYDDDIIDRYEKLPYHPSVIFELWNKYIEYPIKSNPNMFILHIYGKLNDLVQDFKLNPIPSNLENISKISLGLNQISKYLESYFTEPQFTKYNLMYKKSLDIISYLTKIFIGNSIEMTIRKVLFTYFNNSENDIDKINDKIRIILEVKQPNLEQSLLEMLHEKIIPSIIKNCSEMYSTPDEKMGWDKIPVKSILVEFFELFKNSYIITDLELINNVFVDKISNYYDVLCTKCITYWIITIENIYKHFININRNTQSLLDLIN